MAETRICTMVGSSRSVFSGGGATGQAPNLTYPEFFSPSDFGHFILKIRQNKNKNKNKMFYYCLNLSVGGGGKHYFRNRWGPGPGPPPPLWIPAYDLHKYAFLVWESKARWHTLSKKVAYLLQISVFAIGKRQTLKGCFHREEIRKSYAFRVRVKSLFSTVFWPKRGWSVFRFEFWGQIWNQLIICDILGPHLLWFTHFDFWPPMQIQNLKCGALVVKFINKIINFISSYGKVIWRYFLL